MKFLIPSTIKNRFILISTLVSLLPLIFISVFSTYTYTNATQNYVSDAMRNILNSVDSNLDFMFSDVKDMANIVYSLEVVHNIDDEKVPANMQIMNLMGNFTINKKYIKTILTSKNGRISFFDRNNIQLFSTNNIPPTFPADYLVKMKDWNNDFKLYNTNEQWVDGKTIDGNKNALFYVRAYYTGMIAIGVDQNIFDELYSNRQHNEYDIVIADHNHIIYNSTDKLSPGEEFDFINQLNNGNETEKNRIWIEKNKYIYSVKTNDLTKWKIVSLANSSILDNKNKSVVLLTVILIIFSLMLTIGFVILSSEKITRQIKLLTLAIKKFSSMEETDFKFDEKDEVGKIGGEFQRVVRENKTLTSNLYQAIIKQKDAELKALQSQINPHFLYNTLNSIYLMAEKIEAKNISKMVMHLSKIFKFALDREDSFTIIKNEIKHIKSYLEIQQIRYGDKLHVHFDISEEILHKRIIKLLLQPLVENAVFHGLEPKDEPGNIYISGYLREETIIFIVRDDGVGFNTDSFVPHGHGIGVVNVEDRIKLFYGEQYGIHIKSQIGTGTEITVTLRDLS